MPDRPASKTSLAFVSHRATIRRIVAAHKARHPRVFGSVARGDDTSASDLDLLVDTTGTTSLFDIAAMELERVMGVPVHVTTSGALKGEFRQRVVTESREV